MAPADKKQDEHDAAGTPQGWEQNPEVGNPQDSRNCVGRRLPRTAGGHVVAEPVPGGAHRDHDGGHEGAAHGRSEGPRAAQEEGRRPHPALQVRCMPFQAAEGDGMPSVTRSPSVMSLCFQQGISLLLASGR